MNLDAFLALPRGCGRIGEERLEGCVEAVGVLPLFFEVTHVADKGVTRDLFGLLLSPVLDQESVHRFLQEGMHVAQDGPVFEGENV